MLYELIVETDLDQMIARFRLNDEHGEQLGANQVLLTEHSRFLWEGLFDTRRYVERYEGILLWEEQTEPETAEQLLERLGVFLGEKVLGENISRELTRSQQRRTLLVRLPDTKNDLLAAAFARVPWEIARPGEGEPALMERNLVVRLVTKDTAQRDEAVAAVAARVAAGETLRVLLVFAEAPGTHPLAMRKERERLLNLFYKDILPRHNVKVDVLCHGVTLSTLQERIRASNGYHIVHWSGHGHHNLLVLQAEDGSQKLITGEELVDLFDKAGGFIPQLVFLSACLSGTFVGIDDWESLKAALRGERPGEKSGDMRALSDILEDAPGYTGTALALLRSGVPQVVAMRYEVGDDYARELAWWFYRRLLVDPGHPPTDGALALARTDLLRDDEQAAQLGAVNHATPLMFGQDGRLLEPARGRSEQLTRLLPRPQPLLPGGQHELDCPANFVGRREELTKLNVQWLSEKEPDKKGPAVALIQGLAGLGKTVLAAEAIHLWHGRFDWVLAFQAKPTPLTLDDFYRQMDKKLTFTSVAYRDKCDAFPSERVFLEPGQPLTGDERYAQMQTNLLGALRDEAILLVLDNFEANLERIPRPEGYACENPRWDDVLRMLARELPATRSRLLLTSRHRLAVLSAEGTTLWIPIGPLPPAEAGLYLGSHAELRRLMFSDEEGSELVKRLLLISRGHPLILDRLGALAHDKQTLSQSLDQIQSEGLQKLPALFAPTLSDAEREEERRYLEDVATGSIDLLIQRLSPNARRLLWIVTLANEPVSEKFIKGVWSGQSVEDERLEQLRVLVQMADQLPEELRKELAELPPELRELLEGSTARPQVPPLRPPLEELHGAGLLTKEEIGEPDVDLSSMPAEAQTTLQILTNLMSGQTTYGFHELVRERISAWMTEHESERGGLTEEQIWVAYGERYAATFQRLQMSAQEAATEAGRRALVYMVRACAFEKLSSFASQFVTGTQDPTLLRGVIAELQAVVDQAQSGETRWRLRLDLADALRQSGQPDRSFAFYEQAVAEAEEAGNWSDVGVICGNWAVALRQVGQLDEAKAAQLRSADAHRKAGSPRVWIVGPELEALRIDVIQGEAERVLPEIDKRLNEVRGWWRQHRAGESVSEAPDSVFLGRALVSGLDIAASANSQLEQWEACLELLEEIEQMDRELGEGKQQLAQTRYNRYGPLIRLGRLNDAQLVLEGCLSVFREVDDLAYQAKALSALASVWDERGDTNQAIALERQALSVCNRLPDPEDRAVSHGNLSNSLEKAGKPEDTARHHLAAIVYCFVSNHRDHLSTFLRNLGIDMRSAALSGRRYELPPLSELLSRPEFEALGQFLVQFGVAPQQLQPHINQLVEQVK